MPARLKNDLVDELIQVLKETQDLLDTTLNELSHLNNNRSFVLALDAVELKNHSKEILSHVKK